MVFSSRMKVLWRNKTLKDLQTGCLNSWRDIKRLLSCTKKIELAKPIIMKWSSSEVSLPLTTSSSRPEEWKASRTWWLWHNRLTTIMLAKSNKTEKWFSRLWKSGLLFVTEMLHSFSKHLSHRSPITFSVVWWSFFWKNFTKSQSKS